MAESIPMGDTLEVVIDRMRRAGNFANNGAYIAGLSGSDRDPVETADTYIHAAQLMLDEARRALDAVRAPAVQGAGDGA